MNNDTNSNDTKNHAPDDDGAKSSNPKSGNKAGLVAGAAIGSAAIAAALIFAGRRHKSQVEQKAANNHLQPDADKHSAEIVKEGPNATD